ncbi:hypothetical protein OIU84_027963, partial [Salix udensis]
MGGLTVEIRTTGKATCITRDKRPACKNRVLAEFNLGLSKNFRINLLEEDPNDMSCHCPAKDSFDGASQYALYKRLASALHHSVKFGALCRAYVKMMFTEDSKLKQKDENWNQLIKEKGLELIN